VIDGERSDLCPALERVDQQFEDCAVVIPSHPPHAGSCENFRTSSSLKPRCRGSWSGGISTAAVGERSIWPRRIA
jgi:hypothetical protein